jgi:hypothetical protein
MTEMTTFSNYLYQIPATESTDVPVQQKIALRGPSLDLDPRPNYTDVVANVSNHIAQLHSTAITDVSVQQNIVPRGSSLDLDPRLNYSDVVANVTNIFWLHIQKTGTSFFNTIFYHFCPKASSSGRELPMMDGGIVKAFPPEQWCNVSFYNLPRIGFHHPFIERNERFLTFTMFRGPAERLRSAFGFGQHGSLSKNKSFLLFEDFVKEPQIPNCQIKMVLGYKCHQKVEASKLNVSMALERVQSPLFFFGMTDRWDESICLFHSWFGGSRKPFEVMNNRPTKRNNKGSTTIQQPPVDLDTVFVQGVVEIFEERLKEVNCTLVAARADA